MTNTKTHYIADGKYGAELEREYVEVPGEKADGTNVQCGDYVFISHIAETRVDVIRKVDRLIGDYDGDFRVDERVPENHDGGWGTYIDGRDDTFVTLRPTQPEVVRYEGERYELAERWAEVGDLVVGGGKIGNVRATLRGFENGEFSDIGVALEGSEKVDTNDLYLRYDTDDIYVLKPLKPTLESLIDGIEGGTNEVSPHAEVATEGQTLATEDNVLPLLANLARRVSELERQVNEYEALGLSDGLKEGYAKQSESATHHAVQKAEEKTDDLAERIQRNFNDLQRNLETFAQTASNAESLAKSNEKELRELFGTLDERTNTKPHPKESDLMREIRQLLETFEAKDGE